MGRLKMINSGDVRSYLYRSKLKIESLFDQLYGKAADKHHGSLSVPLGPFKLQAAFGSEGELSLDEKLRAVEDGLREQHLIGTLDEPGEYFDGIMPMRWGLFDDRGFREAKDEPLVFFGGLVAEQELVVGLGGSTHHVHGHAGATATYSRSSTQVIYRWLCAGNATWEKPQFVPWWDMNQERGDLFQAATIALQYLRPPTQNLRFLAKTLDHGKAFMATSYVGIDQPRVIIGTPVWVAQEPPYVNQDPDGLDPEWAEAAERFRNHNPKI